MAAPEDFAYARDAGYMFEPVELTHDELVEWLHKSRRAVSLKDVTSAFLVSLGTRRLELRSALGSFAIASHFPQHAYQGAGFCCEVCGAFRNRGQPFDLSELNFERYKWGGIRHDQPEYIAFDLQQFAALEPVTPTHDDLSIMRQIITSARQCEPGARPRVLEQRLAGLLASNKAEREILIQVLAYCGILQPANHPGYYESFVDYSERTEPPGNRFWTYPINWWRGGQGVNEEALAHYFPDLPG